MAQLKKFTVNLKSLDQKIGDPIIAGAGDANGRSLVVLFSQEAQDQLAKNTKVYLKWKHLQLNVKGYNAFTKISDGDAFKPTKWEIKWPQAMLREGDCLCHIELVDDISIACSQNFTLHVLADPDDGSSFVASDDYSLFKEAIIELNKTSSSLDEQFEKYQKEFDEWRLEMDDISQTSKAAYQQATDALTITKKFDDKVNRILEGEYVITIEDF